ncbi:MAG: GNAT family N-acetyltransferase [Candidatus Lokiarchaeota archaeon]
MAHDRFRSIRVTLNNEALFYDYIKNNFAEYLFFHADYTQYPESTEIYMAVDNEEKIQGMILIWENRRIQLRGTAVSLEFLLNGNNYNPISITGFDNHKKLISKFFPDYKKEIALYRMVLKKGEQKDSEKYKFQKLNESYREEIASLMRITDPIYWGSRKPEDILIDENNTWYGIMKEKVLISTIGIWKYETIGYIFVVGTHPDYWNQGYASSLISSILKELFQESKQCFIMVRIANAPALHTYKKLGFSVCNTHYSYERL